MYHDYITHVNRDKQIWEALQQAVIDSGGQLHIS